MPRVGKQTVEDIDPAGKRVFLRVDFNVPMTDGKITDDTRIQAVLPTIQYLLDHGAAVILASHLGRPKGKVVPTLSLRPAADRLSELLRRPVDMAPDSVGPEVEALAGTMRMGDILMLENLRFHPEEEANDADFARRLASLADLYVDDAFGSAHRAHASTTGIADYLPAVAGFLMERELEALDAVVRDPERPLVAVIGGAKISTKMGVLEHLVGVADCFLIGGGMANTLLLAEGKNVGDSLVEEDEVDGARTFLRKACHSGRQVLLPTDVVLADRLEAGAESRVAPVDGVASGWSIVDIGPDTVRAFDVALKGAGTVVWNGPMGIFEIPKFAAGTRAVATALAASHARSVVGGGDSVAAIQQMDIADKIWHVSTGGGASLEYLEGKELPGVAVLRERAA